VPIQLLLFLFLSNVSPEICAQAEDVALIRKSIYATSRAGDLAGKSNIMRDLKRHTSEELHKAIKNNRTESRREWMLWMMERAAMKNANTAKFQLWQAESLPIELTTAKTAHQKLDYMHYNPVEAGFVTNPEDWKYSSTIDYHGCKGLLEIIQLEPLIV
jgi:hypothetical protein